MADTFDPYDETDVFDAASLNTRFASMKNRVNALPVSANQPQALGPNHIDSIISSSRTNTKVLKPKHAVTAESGGFEYYCDVIDSQYPGFNVETFETGGNTQWQRISDSSGGSGAGTQYLTLNLTGITLGSDSMLNAVLIMGNVEFVSIHQAQDRRTSPEPCSNGASLLTIITSVSSTGVRTFYWDTLRITTAPRLFTSRQSFSVDVPHRTLLKTDGADIKEVEILASCIDGYGQANWNTKHIATVRFCQLTAVALQAEVN
jgi:hypothetical protein